MTDLSGLRDTLSPHIYQVPKKELELGLHAALLDEALPVMDTTTYSFKYIGIDPAGNISEPAIREPIYYDISPPIYATALFGFFFTSSYKPLNTSSYSLCRLRFLICISLM